MTSKPTARKLRKKGLKHLLIEDGGLECGVVHGAFLGDPADAQAMAAALREWLKRLKREEASGAAPVYSGEIPLTHLDISNAAITALEALNRRGEPSGSELASLMAELLGVARHRIHMAKQKHSGRGLAIIIETKAPDLGVRELADEVGVAASTVSRWRRDPEYLREVEQSIRNMAEDWMETYGADEIEEREPE